MIKKTLILLILLLGIWTIFLHKYPRISVVQNQWQENMVNAEKYLYSSDIYKNVIVGSSMAYRIKTDSLPSFYNLSLSAQGALDGLNIIKSKNGLPENIYIETNIFYAGGEGDFSKNFSSKILNQMKKYVLLLQADKQPVTYTINRYIIPYFKNHSKVNSSESLSSVANTPSDQTNTSKDNLFKGILNFQIEEYSQPLDTNEIYRKINLLKDYINYFTAQGIEITFFEMPVNPKLVHLNRAKITRSLIKYNFPPSHFKYIDLPPDIADYVTTDGIHLMPDEAVKYTNYFKKNL